MDLNVEIERHSGFCGGVIRAIGTAEKFLAESGEKNLHSLGAIVHNEAELRRLGDKGLVTIEKEDLQKMKEDGRQIDTLLIRAHGEPPQTYSLAEELGIKLIDCTCPVVLRLQKSIRKAYERLKPLGGQLVIFGKIGHAEVLGLLGQVDGDALVVEDMAMLEELLETGKIAKDRPVEIFSQTTKSPVEYASICKTLRDCMEARLQVNDTICSQVASRHSELAVFAASHDVIVFVAGASSSNGRVLYGLCRSHNPRTWQITSTSELDPAWFHDGETVGICGATSTPRWLLDNVAKTIEGF